ncbi:hypothetical protein ACHAQA_005865 [Verticillium albo-atrum]
MSSTTFKDGEASELFDGVESSIPEGVKTVHTNTYPAISPTRAEVSQAGRTALITGASAGIGLGIARSYAQASVSRLILTGRRRDVLDAAVAKLAAEFPKTEFLPRVCDIASLDETAALWDGLRADDIAVDVLVLNAAKFGSTEPIITYDTKSLWSEFETNVRSQLDFTQRFQAQAGFENKQKSLVYITSAIVHSRALEKALPSYVLTKKAGHLLIQTIARAADPKKLQVITYHPGAILSEAAVNAGMTKDTIPFDDIKLPADFGVWAASSEAAFLHGRFVWAAWDLDEMRGEEVQKRLKSDPDFLTIHLVGL